MGALARAGSKEAAPKAPNAPAAEAPTSNARRDSAKSALDISALLHSLAHMRGFKVSRHRPDRGPAGGFRDQNSLSAISVSMKRPIFRLKRGDAPRATPITGLCAKARNAHYFARIFCTT